MQPIFQALKKGFKPQDIINFLLKKYPNQSGKIKKALTAGYSAEQILSYITKGAYQEEPIESGGTLYEQTRNREEAKKENRNNTALKGAALAATTAIAPTAVAALQRALPSQLANLAPTAFQQAASQVAQSSPLNQTPPNLALGQPGMTNTPQNTGNIQNTLPQGISQNPPIVNTNNTDLVNNNQLPENILNEEITKRQKPDYVTILDMLGIRDKLERLRLQGKSPEIIRAAASKMVDKEKLKELNQKDPQAFDKIINDFLSNEPTMQLINKETGEKYVPESLNVKPLDIEENDELGFKAAFKTLKGSVSKDFIKKGWEALKNEKDYISFGLKDPLLEAAKLNYDKGLIKSEEDFKNFVDFYTSSNKHINVPKKGETAFTPKGIGQVIEERNGKYLVEVDGKKFQVSKDEIESAPAEKDVASLFDELQEEIKKTTGQEISRAVSFAGYDDKQNSLAFLPHDGPMYVYTNIPDDLKERIKSLLGKRKTSGENFIGAWTEGTESPAGSEMQKIIKLLQSQRGGKGSEYAYKFDSVYNFLEAAYKAKKRKKK